jgi:DNA-directed RNA polymerase specialized sigma24 family protein
MHDPSGSYFKTTNWSMVIAASDDSKVLGTLLGRYWGPIYAYIRRSGYSREQAADLAQEFIALVLLERGLIQKADQGRGRFRTFIKSALRNFLVDQHRRSTARGRGPSQPLITGLSLEDLEPSEHDEPGGAFDRQWAATLLSIALERVEEECRAAGQDMHWNAFKAALVDPALGQAAPPTHGELAQRLGLPGPERVSSLVQTVRRKFKRSLRQVVEETLADPGHTDEELHDLKHFLGL